MLLPRRRSPHPYSQRLTAEREVSKKYPKAALPHQTGDLVSISRSRSAICRAFLASPS
jgi:hypothetical protein